ncbi:MAG: hypothetical protein M3N32_08635 [Actinomycetota bacterium]|nr:hypothetical protein [Actinomycetota bacterium]
MDEVIFASRIVGLPVLDADGLAIGHAATWSSGPDEDRGPPVIGFVVAAPGRADSQLSLPHLLGPPLRRE